MKNLCKAWAVYFVALVLAGCGESIKYDVSHITIGKKIIFRTDMFYAENLNSKVFDKETYKYKCYLLRVNDVDSFGDTIYQGGRKQLTQINKGMRFTVKKYYIVTTWGVKAAFGTGYPMVVIDDEDGKTCTFVEPLIRENEWVK
jgi:hypothetical protein